MSEDEHREFDIRITKVEARQTYLENRMDYMIRDVKEAIEEASKNLSSVGLQLTHHIADERKDRRAFILLLVGVLLSIIGTFALDKFF